MVFGQDGGVGALGGFAFAEHHVGGGAVDDLGAVAVGDDLAEFRGDAVGVGALGCGVEDDSGRRAAAGQPSEFVYGFLPRGGAHGGEVLLELIDGDEDDRQVVAAADLRGELALGAHGGGQATEQREPAPISVISSSSMRQECGDGFVFGADDQPVGHAAHRSPVRAALAVGDVVTHVRIEHPGGGGQALGEGLAAPGQPTEEHRLPDQHQRDPPAPGVAPEGDRLPHRELLQPVSGEGLGAPM